MKNMHEYMNLNNMISPLAQSVESADEAIDAVNSEQLTDDVDCPSDTAYTNALDCASDWPSSLTVLTKRVIKCVLI